MVRTDMDEDALRMLCLSLHKKTKATVPIATVTEALLRVEINTQADCTKGKHYVSAHLDYVCMGSAPFEFALTIVLSAALPCVQQPWQQHLLREHAGGAGRCYSSGGV